MDWVDAVVAVIVLASAVHGLRLGALVQILSFGGFILGMTLGALLAGAFVSGLRTPTSKTVLSLALVIGLGILLGVAGRILGVWAHGVVARARLGGVDHVLGVGVAVVAALLAVWLVANELAVTQFSWLSSAIQRSAVVRAEDHVMPPLPSVFSRVQGFLNASGLPTVFNQLEPPPVTGVARPTTAFADQVAAAAAGSTVKVLGQACGYIQEGSGFVVAARTVVTNAHVVAGEHQTDVMVGGRTYPASVVLFDPTFDIAVLRTTAPLGPPLAIDPTPVPSTKGAVVGYPEDGPLKVRPAAVTAQIDAQGRNIYNEGTVTREVYEVDADIEPGNSGGPLVGSNGEVIGVVFSRSTVYSGVGYALTSPGVLSHVQQAAGRNVAVGTGACVES